MVPRGLVIVDAARLDAVVTNVDLRAVALVDVTGECCSVSAQTPARGWLRRLAPVAWDHGVRIGSHEAAVLASRLTLLAAILRDTAVSWVTPVDALYPAENKIVQYRAAAACGIRVPDTVVCTDPERLAHVLGEPFVLKPLGPGNFEQRDRQHVVHVRTVRAAELVGAELSLAPFLAQRVVKARWHLRVVTVGHQVWVAELPGTDIPLDWREHGPAIAHFKRQARGRMLSAPQQPSSKSWAWDSVPRTGSSTMKDQSSST